MAAEFISFALKSSGENVQELWNFALRTYAQPGVESACLALQEAGCDVCLLLAGAWLERRATPCTHERLQVLREQAQHWQREVIAPLRRTRQQWRAEAAGDAQLTSLRERLKALELEAERVLLQRLEALAENWPNDTAEAADWLGPLAGPARDSAALQVLRGAAAR